MKPAPIWRVKAAERALKAAGVSAADLDLILLATCTGDYPIPATACLIQHQLGRRVRRPVICRPPVAGSSMHYRWRMPM